MKKLMLCLAIVSLIAVRSYSQAVPNAGFENWYWWGGWVLYPNDWYATNSQLAYTVQQDSTPYAGNFAARLLSSSRLSTGFNVLNHPSSLSFELKGSVSVNDSANISIIVFSNGSAVDAGTFFISSSLPSWTYINVPITQTSGSADSVFILVQGGFQQGTIIVVDDVQLNYTTGMEEVNSVQANVFPNPLMQGEELRWDIPFHGKLNMAIVDASGKKVYAQTFSDQDLIKIKSTNLSKGIYFLFANADKQHFTSRFIVQ